MNPATDREISGPPRRVSPDLSQEFPSRRRRLPRWVTVPALVAALLFGSWAASHLPTSDSVTNDQFLRAGTTGQDVELRMGSMKVTQVRSAAEVQSGNQVARTPGIWLVVDVDFTPRNEPRSLLSPQLSDSMERNFGGFQAIDSAPCGPAARSSTRRAPRWSRRPAPSSPPSCRPPSGRGFSTPARSRAPSPCARSPATTDASSCGRTPTRRTGCSSPSSPRNERLRGQAGTIGARGGRPRSKRRSPCPRCAARRSRGGRGPKARKPLPAADG